MWIMKMIFFSFFLLFHRRYDEDDKAAWQCGSWCEYIFVVVLSSILLLAAIVLTVFWIIYYRGGYSLEDKTKLFNFHPTLMIAGYITLSGFCKWWKLNLWIDEIVKLNEFSFSRASVPHLSMLFALGCEIVSRLFPCLLNSVHRDRCFVGLGMEEWNPTGTFLLVTFLARFRHNGTVRVPIRARILQVNCRIIIGESCFTMC